MRYTGGEDGEFTGAEMGAPSVATQLAALATIEALYFGTMINAYRNVDNTEFNSLNNFFNANGADSSNWSQGVQAQYIDLMIDIYKDPAVGGMHYSTSAVSNLAVLGCINLITLIGLSQNPDQISLINLEFKL
jgi:hypothetical protein